MEIGAMPPPGLAWPIKLPMHALPCSFPYSSGSLEDTHWKRQHHKVEGAWSRNHPFWTFHEEEMNFYCVKPLRFEVASVIAASVTWYRSPAPISHTWIQFLLGISGSRNAVVPLQIPPLQSLCTSSFSPQEPEPILFMAVFLPGDWT